MSWTRGAGVKPLAQCPKGKYVVGFALRDYGGRNEAINQMRCCAIDGQAAISDNTKSVPVSWYGGKGQKEWSDCPGILLVTGIQYTDYARNNQAISSMQCTNPSRL